MIGIRREDKNVWETRAALTPDHVAELVHERGLRFVVQPAEQRAFPDRHYLAAGAEVDEDLSRCTVILGIKEIPPEKLLPQKTYPFFSHTTKGQAHNMPLLRRLIELGCTLLDFEHVFDERKRRLIFFGKHAGYAGMIDTLWAVGRHVVAEGRHTHLERVRLAHEYSGLDEATAHISRLGERLRHDGVRDFLRPFIVAFTGSGNVSEGAQEIYDRLPTQEILPDELRSLTEDPDRPRNVLYKLVLGRADRIEHRRGQPVDLDEFAEHPERYRSAIPRYLPYLTALVHGAFWLPDQPRLVTREDLRALWSGPVPPRLRVIADISCDIGGGIESTVRATSPGNPVYVYDPVDGSTVDGVEGRGPVVMAVDNLPCQLPVESSGHFGDGLFRFVPPLSRCDWTAELDALSLPGELADAIVVHRGKLTPRFAHLAEHVGSD